MPRPRCATRSASQAHCWTVPLTDSRFARIAAAPRRAAIIVALIAFAGYLVTVAPQLTFWDAGEFLVAARTLGLPHPPGTPLFVLLAHVWGLVFPIGEYAWRINLLSAVCSAAACGFWYLVAHDMVTRLHADVDNESREALALLGGAAAALLGAFTFSVWQNATEAEVYAASSLGMAIVGYVATRWREWRSERRGVFSMLLIVYLLALMTSLHIMGLLIGPPVVLFLWVEWRANPMVARDQFRREPARIAVLAAAWCLLVGVGLANPSLCIAATALVVAAVAFAVSREAGRFAAAATMLLVVGISATLFLLLRAQQHPWLNEGNPDTWRHFVDVIGRAQYPQRSPFDDPTVLHGAGNPGRTWTLLMYQLANYAQYFDWQWARSLGDPFLPSIPRLAVTLLMVTLGIRGAFVQRRRDASAFALVAGLFAVAGPMLVLYLNFKPGSSIGWNRWLHGVDHEVRDRDYFFVASFVAWSIWVGIALIEIIRNAMPRVSRPRRPLVLALLGVALIPLAGNFRDADRRSTPDVDFPRAFSRAMLASVPPNGILLTRGDNATFPLWYLQQVEGVRTDVTVVSLDLAETTWYIKAIRNREQPPATRLSVGMIWGNAPLRTTAAAIHDLDDSTLDAFRPFRVTRPITLDLGRFGNAVVPVGAAFEPLELVLFDLLRYNAGRRPIAWSLTADDALYGLGTGMVQEGLVYVMPVDAIDSTQLAGGAAAGTNGIPVDLGTTRRLVDGLWDFGALEATGTSRLDGNVQAVAGTVTQVMTQLGWGLAARGDTAGARTEWQRAVRLSGDSAAKAALGQIAHP